MSLKKREASFRRLEISEGGEPGAVPLSSAWKLARSISSPGPLATQGTNGDDHLFGTAAADHLEGLGGNDRLEGLGGDDLLEGGEGNDRLEGGTGSDNLLGGAGNDYLEDRLDAGEQGGLDQLSGGEGDDGLTLQWGSFGPDTPALDSVLMDGGEGKDILQLFSERVFDQATMLGGGGDDRLSISVFEAGSVTIDAGSGNDIVSVGGWNVSAAVTLGTGADLLYLVVDPVSTSDVVVLDFEPGDGGDRLNLHIYFGGLLILFGPPSAPFYLNYLEQWDGNTNPFATGHFRLVQSGADTLVQVDRDGAGPLAFETRITLQGVAAASLTAYNFNNLPPDGSAPAAQTIVDENVSFYLTGTLGSDTIIGLDRLNWIEGFGGNDRIEGNGGDDIISGGAGDDIVIGGAGNDVLYGGAGNDVLSDGGSESNLLWGESGDDVYLIAGNAQIVEFAGEGDDTLVVSMSYDLSFYPGNSIETLTTANQAGTDAIDLTGNDLSQTLHGNDGINILRGGDGNDSLLGHGGEDALHGDDGDDILDGGTGADTMAGATGDDAYFVDNAGDVVIEVANEGYDVIYAGVSYALAADSFVEVLATIDNTASTPLTLIGNEFANYVTGNAGANILDGGAGPDQLWGRGGDDSYYADAGDDVVEYDGDGYDILYARSSYALGIGQSIEVLATIDNNAATAINLTGNALSNYIVGNAGANTLDGGGGDDQLWGREGDDSYIADMNDIVLEYAGQGSDILYATASYILAAGLSIETLATADNNATTSINLTGNELDNYVTGNAGANTLDGGTGSDTLWGRAGDDSYFADGNDVVREDAGQGSDIVYARGSFVLGAGVSVEILATADNTASTALNLTGNELANYVTGNAGANVLDGGAGADQLFGRGGTDTFAFTSALGNGNVDHILDFMSGGLDRIALDDAVFAGLTPGALPQGAFAVGSSAQEADDRILYNSQTGQLFFDADGSGAGAAILFAIVTPGTGLSASDFTVI